RWRGERYCPAGGGGGSAMGGGGGGGGWGRAASPGTIDDHGPHRRGRSTVAVRPSNATSVVRPGRPPRMASRVAISGQTCSTGAEMRWCQVQVASTGGGT